MPPRAPVARAGEPGIDDEAVRTRLDEQTRMADDRESHAGYAHARCCLALHSYPLRAAAVVIVARSMVPIRPTYTVAAYPARGVLVKLEPEDDAPRAPDMRRIGRTSFSSPANVQRVASFALPMA
jgi:hypothetical protein